MAKYVLTMTDLDSRQLDRWTGGMLMIGPAGSTAGVPVAGLDLLAEPADRRERGIVQGRLTKAEREAVRDRLIPALSVITELYVGVDQDGKLERAAVQVHLSRAMRHLGAAAALSRGIVIPGAPDGS